MNAAELFLRLGCTMVGWLMVFTHLLWLGTLRVVTCNSDGDAMWRMLLALAPLAVLFSFTLSLTRKLSSVHSMLRWGIVPTVLLSVLALLAVWPALQNATLAGVPICAVENVGWHTWWAPIQLGAIGLMLWNAFAAFRDTPASAPNKT